jgi:hypothetical protein
MKRILLFGLAAIAVSVVAFAQDYGPRGQNGPPRQNFVREAGSAGEELTLNGELGWVNGRIAIKTEDKTYFVSGLQRLFGFVDGLKEGAQLTLTGRAYGVSYIPEYGFFRTEKVSFNGKNYELNYGGPGFGGMMHEGRSRHGRGMMYNGW